MYNAKTFISSPKCFKQFTTCAEDRPLFVQFCANDPKTLLSAARLVEGKCDAVDLNFGCPQVTIVVSSRALLVFAPNSTQSAFFIVFFRELLNVDIMARIY